jgi:hypothetical protein
VSTTSATCPRFEDSYLRHRFPVTQVSPDCHPGNRTVTVTPLPPLSNGGRVTPLQDAFERADRYPPLDGGETVTCLDWSGSEHWCSRRRPCSACGVSTNLLDEDRRPSHKWCAEMLLDLRVATAESSAVAQPATAGTLQLPIVQATAS